MLIVFCLLPAATLFSVALDGVTAARDCLPLRQRGEGEREKESWRGETATASL